MTKSTVLIEATVDRVDTKLVRAHSDREPTLYRLSLQNDCYFVDLDDVDRNSFERVTRLKPGMKLTACVFEDRENRHHVRFI